MVAQLAQCLGFDLADALAGTGLVGIGAGDALANPPGGVRAEFVAAAPLELFRSPHQADVAFLNQVEELQAAG